MSPIPTSPSPTPDTVVTVGITIYTTILAALDAMDSEDWTLYDGPTPSGDTPGTYIVFGSNGEGNAIDSSQQDTMFGSGADWETGTIYALVASSNGDGVTATARDNVMSAYSDITAACAGLGQPYEAHVTAFNLQQLQTSSGAEAVATVEISYAGALT